MKFVEMDVGPVVLAVAEAGAGGHPLLLLHGFTGAKEDFADWIDAFADQGFHAVAPDHRGHGASSHPEAESDYSMAIFATDGLALVDQLGWERFALLGHSMGGMVAQEMALAAPGRVSALVLMDTTYTTVGIDPAIAQLAAEVARTEGIDVLADLSAALQSPLQTGPDQRVRAEREGYVEFGERKLRACSAAMYAAMATELLSPHDRRARLATLAVPVLVVVGDQDAPFLEPAQVMADTIPGARLAVIPDAGHSPQFESPEPWWAAVDGFLVEVAPA